MSATGNWNVNDLLNSALQRTLSWVKTLISISRRTTTCHWNVDDLLDELREERHIRCHFHQLLRHLRLTENRA